MAKKEYFFTVFKNRSSVSPGIARETEGQGGRFGLTPPVVRKMPVLPGRDENMYRIMIVEDDITISTEIAAHLSRWGYEVFQAADFEHITEEFAVKKPHLLLLDILLPFYNGYYWCSQIRRISSVPIVFLSSASENMNIVMAMNMGGDDFISKPFSLDVLSAKVQAVLRRSYESRQEMHLLEYQGVILNLADACVLYEGKQTELTKNEFRILELLFERAGKLTSRDELMRKLWDNECFVDDNTLTVNITRIRRKLSEAGLSEFICTKKGIGYYLQGAVAEEGGEE